MTKIYLIAGEASGDMLGAKLMRALRRQFPEDLSFYGIGGEAMAHEGLASLFDIKPLSVMGFFEVLPALRTILALKRRLIDDIMHVVPDIVITIDSYSFSAQIHKELKKRFVAFPHVHVVAPQVWAWKAGRAKKVHRFIDYLFCLLPGEEDYFLPYQMPACSVGHPVIEDSDLQVSKNAARSALGLSQDALVLSLLPGSRTSEIKYLLKIFKRAVDAFSKQHPDLFVFIPVVEPVRALVEKALTNWEIPHRFITGEHARHTAFCASDLALAASGTVSLELALARVPHIIAYRMNPLTAWLAKHFIKVPYVNLINILSHKEVIPELLQKKCTSQEILFQLQQLIFNPYQETALALKKLGFGGEQMPSDKIAEKIKRMILHE